MIFTLICCCALFAPIVYAAEPSISHITKEQIKSINETVVFDCTVQNLQNYKVLWFKIAKNRNDRAPLTAGSEPIVADPRFEAFYNKTTSTFSLKINKLQESDTGFYQCQIIISLKDSVSAEVELQINRQPTINRKNSTHTAEVAEGTGTSVELHCYADGFPVPRISWKREGDVLLSTGSAIYRGNVLKIQDANKDDRGMYYCIAENGVGAEDRHNVSVRVIFKPVVKAVRPRVGQAPGYDIDLKCKIEAYPAPKISWYKGENELKREQLANSGNRSEFVEVLTRYSVSSSDYGQYVCRAENERGIAETQIDLFETIVPVCASSCG